MVVWRKPRGLFGPLSPLMGRWVATAAKMPDGSEGECAREFAQFGPGFIRLDASWAMGERGTYKEVAFFGRSDDGSLAFWSFTADGKRSTGVLCDASDVHADAIAFVAEMSAGTARMVYWPDEGDEDGFHFAVESKTKKGWNRFLDHRYRRA